MSNYATASCDVLVLGGGIGGLSCAVATKEALPEADVLVVEKNFAGYAGKANRGGGVLHYDLGLFLLPFAACALIVFLLLTLAARLRRRGE